MSARGSVDEGVLVALVLIVAFIVGGICRFHEAGVSSISDCRAGCRDHLSKFVGATETAPVICECAP